MKKAQLIFLDPKHLNYLFALLPISFAIGNFAINLNVIIIIFLGIYFFRKDIYNFQDKFFLYLIIIFFFYLIISTFINNYDDLKNSDLLKSFAFLRYLVFLMVVNCMVKKELFN